jgi:hypothetical protein
MRPLTMPLIPLLLVLVAWGVVPARSQEGGSRWSADGVARIAPQLSETLGSIFAGAELCDMPNEARAVAAKHSEHLDRLAREMPGMDIEQLQRSFVETSQTYRGNPGHNCGDGNREHIRQNLPDVFASIDAFHDALGHDALGHDALGQGAPGGSTPGGRR